MKSVTNIRQITSAMEMVAASKLQKAQDATFASRLYASSAREVLTRLKMISSVGHPFFAPINDAPILYIVFTSDRGLAGAYTAKVMKELVRSARNTEHAKIIMIGKRGAQLLSRLQHSFDVIGVYPSWQRHPTLADISPIAQTAMQLFRDSTIGQVVLVYTDFHSMSHQEAISKPILPISEREVSDAAIIGDEQVRMEPSAEELLEHVLPRFIEVQIYQASLEAAASEHMSRMTSMHAASDNASDIIDSLTLEYNSARQAGITQELAEIAAGAQAIL